MFAREIADSAYSYKKNKAQMWISMRDNLLGQQDNHCGTIGADNITKVELLKLDRLLKAIELPHKPRDILSPLLS